MALRIGRYVVTRNQLQLGARHKIFFQRNQVAAEQYWAYFWMDLTVQ